MSRSMWIVHPLFNRQRNETAFSLSIKKQPLHSPDWRKIYLLQIVANFTYIYIFFNRSRKKIRTFGVADGQSQRVYVLLTSAELYSAHWWYSRAKLCALLALQSPNMQHSWPCRAEPRELSTLRTVDAAEPNFATLLTVQSQTLQHFWHCRIKLCAFSTP
jgi:hypothetical protein